MVPRSLLHDVIQEHPETAGDKEAFLRVYIIMYFDYIYLLQSPVSFRGNKPSV